MRRPLVVQSAVDAFPGGEYRREAHDTPPRAPPDALPSRWIGGGDSSQPPTAGDVSSSRRQQSTTLRVFITDNS